MSQPDIVRFLEFVASDPDVANAFVLAVGDKQGAAAYQAVSAFARSAGHDIDSADAQAMQSMFTRAQDANRDLVDGELAGVDGGVIGETAIILATGAIVVGMIAAISVGGIAAAASTIPPVRNWFSQW